MAQRHFPLGRTAHAACMQSVRGMLQLLKITFTRAPEGIVNYTKLCSVLESRQGCRPVGRCSCTGNQVCDGALQAHGTATQEV